jgi:hypothetical protein
MDLSKQVKVKQSRYTPWMDSSLMMEAVRTSETSVDNHLTWQYIPEDNSEHHTRRRENFKSHMYQYILNVFLRVYVFIRVVHKHFK